MTDPDEYDPKTSAFILDGTPLAEIASVEWTGGDADLSGSAERVVPQGTFTGLVTFAASSPVSLTLTHDDGTETTYEDVEVLTEAQRRERAAAIREQAPEERLLADGRTRDIEDVIDALEAAREAGVEYVDVNDDGQARTPRPYLRNNHARYRGMAPPPGELREWVEL